MKKDITNLITNAIDESKKYIDMYENKIKYYNEELQLLEKIRPFFFMRKKLCINEQKKEELLESIRKYENEIEEEKKIICKMISIMNK